MDPLLTTAILTGILALFTMMFRSVRSSDCWKTRDGVCCECATRSNNSNSNLDIIPPAPTPVITHVPVKESNI